MNIELNDDSVDQYGRCLTFYVDDEAAEVIKFFVDALMGRTKPNTTDQGDVTRQ